MQITFNSIKKYIKKRYEIYPAQINYKEKKNYNIIINIINTMMLHNSKSEYKNIKKLRTLLLEKLVFYLLISDVRNIS